MFAKLLLLWPTLVKLCNILYPVLLFLWCIFLYFRNLAVSVRIIVKFLNTYKCIIPQCLFSMLWWHCSQPDLLEKCTKRYNKAYHIQTKLNLDFSRFRGHCHNSCKGSSWAWCERREHPAPKCVCYTKGWESSVYITGWNIKIYWCRFLLF